MACPAAWRLSWHTPAAVKLAVAGRGNASKQQVADAIRAMLNPEQAARVPDDHNVTDAMAVALTAAKKESK